MKLVQVLAFLLAIAGVYTVADSSQVVQEDLPVALRHNPQGLLVSDVTASADDNHDHPLDAVWLQPHAGNGYWETDWIREIFALAHLHPNLTVTADPKQVKCTSVPMILVYHLAQNFNQLGPEFTNGTCRFGLMHLSDEGLTEDLASYKHAQFIFRNYYRPQDPLLKRVVTFGLGYKQGFWDGFNGLMPLARSVRLRRFVWSFAGTISHHSSRREAIEVFKNITPHKIVETARFNDQNGLQTSDYRRLLMSSIFVLCPIGQSNLDTFRHYEAMEAGAIPITIGTNPLLHAHSRLSYWELVFGKRNPVPFVVGRSWEGALKKVEELISDMHSLELLRQKTYHFWQLHKKDIAVELSKQVYAMRTADVQDHY